MKHMPKEWILRDVSHDYGLDKNVEIVDAGNVTGKNFSVQLKATDRRFSQGTTPTIALKVSTLEYMASRPEPVMIVLYSETDGEGFWVWRHELQVSARAGQKFTTVTFDCERKLSSADWQSIQGQVFSFLARPTVDLQTVARLDRFGRYYIDLSRVGILLREEVDHLETLVNNRGVREHDLQLFIESHPHVILGGEYIRLHAQLAIDRPEGRLVPDFFVESVTGLCDILEIKLPSARTVRRQKNRDRPASAVFEGAAQVRAYSSHFDEEAHRKSFEEAHGLKVYRPFKMLLIGRDSDFINAYDRRRIELTLGDCRIFTYDDLIRMARAKQAE